MQVGTLVLLVGKGCDWVGWELLEISKISPLNHDKGMLCMFSSIE